jgi:hypothetical protein
MVHGWIVALWLAVADQEVNDVFSQIEKVGKWSEHTLTIGLFVLILFITYWMIKHFLKLMLQERLQFTEEKKARETDRREYIESLKGLAHEQAIVIERNTEAFRQTQEVIKEFRNDIKRVYRRIDNDEN